MCRQPWMRRFDFDAEAAVRLCWRGIDPINISVPVRYFRADEGGVSHFRLLAGQRAADLDALAVVLRFSAAAAAAGGVAGCAARR